MILEYSKELKLLKYLYTALKPEQVKPSEDELNKVSKPKPLNIDDILFCLVLDAQSGTESFEDFCDNFGYNEDSVKHNEIYKSCQKNGKKVKTFIKDLEKASELFQDY